MNAAVLGGVDYAKLWIKKESASNGRVKPFVSVVLTMLFVSCYMLNNSGQIFRADRNHYEHQFYFVLEEKHTERD